jgi:plastocyanin
MRIHPRSPRPAALAFAAALALAIPAIAACGGTSADKTPTEPPSTPTASATRATSPTVAASPTATTAVAEPTSTPAAGAPGNPAPTAPTASTQPPPPPAATATSAPPPPPTSADLTIVGVNISFSPSSVTAPAGTPVTITFVNQDAGIAHNINVFAPGGGSIGATEIASGPATHTLSLGALAPGTYRFRCDVHPQQMTGVLTVS